MGRYSASWWRETFRLYILYMAVGTVFAPFGLVYGLLVLKGWDHWLSAIALLGAGFLVAQFVWRRLETRLLLKAADPITTVSFSVSAGEYTVASYSLIATPTRFEIRPALARQVGVVATILVPLTYPGYHKAPLVHVNVPTDIPPVAASVDTITLPVQ